MGGRSRARAQVGFMPASVATLPVSGSTMRTEDLPLSPQLS